MEKVCGYEFVDDLLEDMYKKLHWQAREVFKSRVLDLEELVGLHFSSNFSLDDEKKRHLIENVILFRDVKKEQFPALLACLHVENYESGDTVINQGDEGDSLYIIIEGTAQVDITDIDGETRVITYLGNNDFFGEIALLNDCRRTASVRALSSLTVLSLHKNDFANFSNLHQEQQKSMMVNGGVAYAPKRQEADGKN